MTGVRSARLGSLLAGAAGGVVLACSTATGAPVSARVRLADDLRNPDAAEPRCEAGSVGIP
jgi:hypothetical protein